MPLPPVIGFVFRLLTGIMRSASHEPARVETLIMTRASVRPKPSRSPARARRDDVPTRPRRCLEYARTQFHSACDVMDQFFAAHPTPASIAEPAAAAYLDALTERFMCASGAYLTLLTERASARRQTRSAGARKAVRHGQ